MFKKFLISLILFIFVAHSAMAYDTFVMLNKTPVNINTISAFKKDNCSGYIKAYKIVIHSVSGKELNVYYADSFKRDNDFNRLLKLIINGDR